jgi:Ni/Fe-hydrogenase 1 B-type cytochrome subunit
MNNIRYVLVWSGWMRLCHGVIGLGVLFQIASAWLIDHDDVGFAFWHDWHVIVGQIVFVALIVRFILLFIPGSSHWRSLIPKRSQLDSIFQMIKFYVSLMRSPLPNWYAHSPFWQPLYLIFLFVLLASSISGFLINAPYLIAGFSIDSLHSAFASFIIIFTVAHIVTAVLHDLKGKGSNISAMINGYRYFHVDSESNASPDILSKKVRVAVPIKDITRRTNRSELED